MRSLPLPLIDERALYDRMSAKRGRLETRRLLDAARLDVLTAYDNYALASLYGMTSVIADEPTEDALKSNYEVLRSGALVDDGSEILGRSRICCLCGVRPTAELDHFLPKEDFPELSILTVNLVPVCGVCNRRKGRGWVDSSGEPMFLHAYFEPLPSNKRYLRARVIVDQRSVAFEFRIKRTRGMAVSTARLLQAQFDYLDLETAYRENAIELIGEKAQAIREYYAEGGAAQVREYLAREAASVARPYGHNHWKPAALRAASRSVDFCSAGFSLL